MNGKVGSYAVTSINFNTWFNEDQNVKVITKNKKPKNKKKIIYPIFLEFVNHTSDIFWEKKLNTFANGKLPKFFSFNNNKIIFKKNNNIVECELTNDYIESTNLCIQFFKTYGGIFSKKDEIKEIEELSSSDNIEYNKINTPKTWSQIDKKMKEIMMKKFVHDMASEINLNKNDINLLLQTIKLANLSKTFNKNNFIVENEKLVRINGLKWQEENRFFKIDYAIITNKNKNKNDESSQEDEDFFEYSKDMITQYSKKIEKYFDYYHHKYIKYSII